MTIATRLRRAACWLLGHGRLNEGWGYTTFTAWYDIKPYRVIDREYTFCSRCGKTLRNVVTGDTGDRRGG